MRLINSDFEFNEGSLYIKGSVGKHGEVLQATIYQKERPLLSLTGDFHKVADFDGIMIFNVQGELTQGLGIYYHGDLYPLSRKLVCDMISRLVHSAVGKGRSKRKNLYKLKVYYPLGQNELRISDGEIDLCRFFHGNVHVHRELECTLLGKDKNVLKIQMRVLVEVMKRPGAEPITYSKKLRLVSKHELIDPLVPRT